MEVLFDHLGFEAEYECTVDPEFPGTGSWSVNTFSFHRDGTVVSRASGLRTGTGRPLVASVRPAGKADPWVGFFESGYGPDGAMATPDPHRICVMSGGNAYIVEVRDPESVDLVHLMGIRGFLGLKEMRLLILWDWFEAVGVGPSGVVWTSPPLGHDDLEILGVDDKGIVCRSEWSTPEDPRTFHIDPATGRPIETEPFSE
jgi:hypothetical protein